MWMYAVAEHAPVVGLDRVGAVGGGRVRTVAAAGLTAIAGDVRLEEFGEPAPGPGGPARPQAGSGAAYLRRRRDELSARESSHHEAMASAELVHARLSRLAAGTRLHPPQAPQLTGTSAQMMLNAAYLLDEQRADDFSAAVTDLAGRHPALRLELTGPWPPYSFAGLPDAEEP